MESDILRKAVTGDSYALTVFVDKYKDMAFNLALGIVKNREDARDITQDSFLKVLENIHKFRKESKISTWLYRIVYNSSLNFIEKKKIRQMDEYLGTESISTMKTEMDIDQYEDLHEAIDKLGDKEKTVVVLFYLAEKSLKEVREITGESISNIKVILHRARNKMYKILENERAR